MHHLIQVSLGETSQNWSSWERNVNLKKWLPWIVCKVFWTNLCLFVNFYGPTFVCLSAFMDQPCHSVSSEWKSYWASEECSTLCIALFLATAARQNLKLAPFKKTEIQYSLSLQSRRFLQQCHDPLSCRQFAKASIRLPDNMRIIPINANSPKAMKYNFPKTILTSGMSRI